MDCEEVASGLVYIQLNILAVYTCAQRGPQGIKVYQKMYGEWLEFTAKTRTHTSIFLECSTKIVIQRVFWLIPG